MFFQPPQQEERNHSGKAIRWRSLNLISENQRKENMSGNDQSRRNGNNVEGLNPPPSVMEYLDELLQNATRHQEETLRKILDDNANCEYLVRNGLMSGATKEAFKESIPIVDYVDIEEYIERIAEYGDKSPILCNYPVLAFGLSSGTTSGKPKKFPMTSKYFEQFYIAMHYAAAIKKRAYPPSEYPGLYSGKILCISVAGDQYETKGGYDAGVLSTNLSRGKNLRENYEKYRYSSPIEVALSGDSRQATYCHLLCALLQASDVWAIETGFAFTVAAFFRTLQQSWQHLCEDIRNGTLNHMITDDNIRKAMLSLLKPNPELADLVEKECSKSLEGIAKRLWPNILYIDCIATGPVMKYYVSKINYYSGNLPILSRQYGAAEGGILGLNMDLKRPVNEAEFTLMPKTAFYEFIPLEMKEGAVLSEGDKPQTVELDGLEIGHHYAIVVTTFQGLYRYRLDDVLRFTGFRKKCPTFEYIGRRNVSFAVSGDRVGEEELQEVMEKASTFLKKHGVELLDYTSCVDQSTTAGHYVVFIELDSHCKKGEELDEVMQECCCLLDSSFNYHYRCFRNSGIIGALELRLLQAGTFEDIFNYSFKQGAAAGQYKPPRCVVSSSLQDILNSGVIRAFKSSVCSRNL